MQFLLLLWGLLAWHWKKCFVDLIVKMSWPIDHVVWRVKTRPNKSQPVVVNFFEPVYLKNGKFGLFLSILAYLSQIYALSGVLFTNLKSAVLYQNWQISGITKTSFWLLQRCIKQHPYLELIFLSNLVITYYFSFKTKHLWKKSVLLWKKPAKPQGRSPQKKNVFFFVCPNERGRALPKVFGTFSKGAFLVNKGVYFFQKANNLNF